MDSRKLYQLLSGAFAVHVVGYTLQLTMYAVLPIYMGLTNYGLFVLCLSWALLLSKISMLGLEPVLTRFISIYTSRQQADLVQHIQKWSLKNCIIAAISLGILTGVTGHCVQIINSSVNPTVFWLTGLSLACCVPLNIQGAVLRGQGRPVASQIGVNCVRPIIVIIAIIVGNILFKRAITAAEGLVIYSVASFIGLLAVTGVAHLGQATVKEKKDKHYRRHGKLWKLSAAPLMISSVATLLLRRTDLIVLGIFQSPEEVGIYNIAICIASLCLFATPVVDAVLGSRIADFYSTKNINALQVLITKASRISLLVVALITILIGLAVSTGNRFLDPEYHINAILICTLLSGWISVGIVGPIGLLLSMTGHEYRQLKCVIGACLLNLVLNFALIPIGGMQGAAIATALTTFLSNLMLTRVAKQVVGISTSPFHRIRPSNSEQQALVCLNSQLAA